MCCNEESTKRVLELPVMVYTDDLKGRDPFDTQTEYKSSLATLCQEISNNMAIDKL